MQRTGHWTGKFLFQTHHRSNCCFKSKSLSFPNHNLRPSFLEKMDGICKKGGGLLSVSRKFQYCCTDSGRQGHEIAFAQLTFNFFSFLTLSTTISSRPQMNSASCQEDRKLIRSDLHLCLHNQRNNCRVCMGLSLLPPPSSLRNAIKFLPFSTPRPTHNLPTVPLSQLFPKKGQRPKVTFSFWEVTRRKF